MSYPNPSQPPVVYPQTVVVPTSGKATASLILGIAALITCGLTGPAAVVLGHLAWTDTASGRRGGHGATVAGLALGYLTALPLLGFLLFGLLPTVLGGSTGQ